MGHCKHTHEGINRELFVTELSVVCVVILNKIFTLCCNIPIPLQIGTNGLISFDSAYNPFGNEEFPGSPDASSRYLVALFWDDIDISRGGVGQVSYEIHTSGYYLDQVSDFLKRQRPSGFRGTWMLVTYWDSVRPYPGSSSPEVSST